MDIHYLCDEAPINVPAQPWTEVTRDRDLVSHLVSLYFTWDYPFNSFLDERVFLKHMATADLGSQFCSPFLVNALLSNACVGIALRPGFGCVMCVDVADGMVFCSTSLNSPRLMLFLGISRPRDVISLLRPRG